MSSGGLADCVTETVNSKLGKIRGASLEIALVVNDWRARQVGGMETALMLWESCCIPSLLHGAGTWMEISSATEKQLNKLQCWYIRLILQIGPGSPVAALNFTFSLLDMKIRIWREKLLMIIHIRDLDKESLANRVYEEQKAKKWPGLAQETQVICEQLGVEDCNTTRLSKIEYRKLVTAACHKKNEEIIRNGASEKKCQRIKDEPYGKKEYISSKTISDARKWFKTRYFLQPFAGNYSHNRKYAKSDWLCRCRKAKEDESHITSGNCQVYGDLSSQFGDLQEDKNLVEFFNAVLDRRDTLEDKDRKQQSLTTVVAAKSDPRNRLSRSRDLHLIGTLQL